MYKRVVQNQFCTGLRRGQRRKRAEEDVGRGRSEDFEMES